MNMNGNFFQTSSYILNGFDAVVDTGGTGDYTTLQAADDVLDAGAYSMWVKQGTYAAGVTVSTNNAYIFVEPGTVVEAAITLSGTGIRLELGAQCDIQGVVTLSGNNCSLICHGGCDLDGIVVSGDTGFVDGGGWDTLVNGGTANHAIEVTSSTSTIVQNIACQTTAGGGEAYDGVMIDSTCTYISIDKVKVLDSDDTGIDMSTNCSYISITNCVILGADAKGIQLAAPQSRVTNCYVTETASFGINAPSTADNGMINSNIVENTTGAVINIGSTGEDMVVVGNRTDGATADASGTSTVASNEETAF